MAQAIACALLLLAGNMAGELHLATVRHAVCAAHGQLVHREHAHAGGERAPDGQGPVLMAAGDRSAGHHEHCSTPLKHRERLVAWQARTTLSRPDVERASLPARAPPRAEPRRARILLAPKHSPPARAIRVYADDLRQA